MEDNKRLLFSVTKDDCDWKYSVGPGPGGQKRNKTATKVQCKHRASGAIGTDDSTRNQRKNKINAFVKMSQTKEFKAWHKMEVCRYSNVQEQVEEYTDRQMQPQNLRVEKFDSKNKKWIDYDN